MLGINGRINRQNTNILNIDPVSLWQYFLPTVLSLAGKRIGLDVESHLIPAIAWTCIVGESGTGKSRAESVILGNLKQRQYRERKRWQEQMLEYKQITQSKSKNDDIEIEPPAPERKYLFEVATIQAVMRRLSEQHDNGSIWARDEIARI
jgi:ABC-type glutathione transport system ATPase component